ncbi:hypothetical protein Peur_030102 [Populus x canadensis]
MGVIGFCVDSNRVVLCGKRKLRSLFWRIRAEIRRQVKSSKSKQRLSFNYDPFSYALNFDDGNFVVAFSTVNAKPVVLSPSYMRRSTCWTWLNCLYPPPAPLQGKNKMYASLA